MEIKEALRADAKVLAEIVTAANIPVAEQFGLTRDNVPNHPSFCTEEWILKGMDRGERYFLVESGKDPVGCVAYESPEPALAFLNRLAVLPEAQGQGLGTALVDHVVRLARSRGNQKISIGIIKAHTRLKDWYERLGFVPAGTKQFDHLPFDVLFMHRNLKDANMGTASKVLITRKIPEFGINMLRQAGIAMTLWPEDRPMTAEELLENAKGHKILLCTLTEKISRAFLTANPQLEMISQFAVGYDNIDITAATERGIPVGFTPDVMAEATADIAFGLMIATARKMFFHHKQIQAGNWDFFRPTGHLGMELKEKTLGIMGMGRIGMKMARRCKGAYDMKILYHSRKPNPEADKALDASWVSFEDLLAQSDVVSVHTVLSPETRGVFNVDAFERMKPEALFINTARGPIHNETDLRAALETGKIGGAGLDVTDPEPMDKNNPLLGMENVCILPHIGSATREARDGMSRLAARNIIDFITTGVPGHLVNPEAVRS